ncbi:hypothetical protein PRIPAC_86085 [Pristionchus pacificus]|uniref:DUF4440 domain-containing protein n=1 Tax=Pristionchus pacificus TaxID=54126 RepID=A0A8R1V859_PRIPA|nr:hypothetical protein PRIPAC_86085 [Pristionchus pacificus]
MADQYAPIFEAIVKKNLAAFAAGDVAGAAEMYDEQAVVVDKKQAKSYFGTDEIKQMIEGFLKLGKVEFKNMRKEFYGVGDTGFLVDSDFEMTFSENGVAMKGSTQHLYYKKGDQWKCVYEGFEMQ